MNGWWWDPAAPGRGFFIEYAHAAWQVAHCGYGNDGNPMWETAGPVAGSGNEIAEGDFRLVFKGRDRARLEWHGERIDLAHQHSALRNAAPTWDSQVSGWFVEEGAGTARTFICEQLGRRIFAALLAQGEWLLFEATQGANDAFAGPWRRYEGGPTLAPALLRGLRAKSMRCRCPSCRWQRMSRGPDHTPDREFGRSADRAR